MKEIVENAIIGLCIFLLLIIAWPFDLLWHIALAISFPFRMIFKIKEM